MNEATDEIWTLTMYFLDATGKKEVAEKLSFASKQALDDALKPFQGDHENKTGKIFRITNESGEYIEFRGQHWRRNAIKKDAGGLY